VVLTITDHQHPYAEQVAKVLRDKGFRVDADLRNEKIGFKIREHTLQKVPYLLVVGDREMESGSIALRDRHGADLGVISVEAVSQRLSEEVSRRAN